MKSFSEWSKGDQPTGLEGIKKRLTEAYREFGDAAQRRPQRKPQPKPQTKPEPKTDEFDDVPSNVVDQLRGLVKREPNPEAQQKALQAHVARWRANQAKPAEEPKAAPAPEPEKKLSLTPNTSLSGGGGTKPPTKPPVGTGGSKPEPEPDDGTGGKLDSLISQIRDGQIKGGQGKQMVERLKMALTSYLENNKGSNAQREILSRLSDARGELAAKVIDRYMDIYSPEKMQRFQETNNFSDPDSVIEFMKENFGMIDKNGQLHFGPQDLATAIAHGHSLSSVKGSKPYFGRQLHEILASRGDMSHADGVLGSDSEYDGVRKFHQKTLKNNVSTQMSREVYQRLSPRIQSYLNGLGQPQGSTGVFNPPEDWEMNFNVDNGIFSGDSDFDLGQLDKETLEQWKSNIGTGDAGQMRGIMMLQKMIAHGFTDELTGTPFMGGLQSITADHIKGRKTVEDGSPTLDNPFNLALISKNLNQQKSGEGKDASDTFGKLLSGGLTKLGGFGPVIKSMRDEDGNPLSEEEQLKYAWLAERLSAVQFGPKILKVLGADSDQDGEVSQQEQLEFIEDITGIGDMDSKTLKEYMLASGDNPGVHLDLANLTKLPPRKDGALSPNSWRGASGNSYNGTEMLDGFRKSMLVRLMTDPELGSDIQAIRAKMAGKPENKIKEAVLAARKAWANKNLKMPMQGHSAIFGLGRQDNETFVNWFRENGAKNLEGIKDSHPELHKQLTSQLGDLDKWLPKLKTYVGGDSPFKHEQGSPKVLQDMFSEWGRQIMRSAAARQQMSPEEIEAFYAGAEDKMKKAKRKIADKDRWFDDDGNRLGPFSENWLNPDTDLL